jgi:hypothetical protein
MSGSVLTAVLAIAMPLFGVLFIGLLCFFVFMTAGRVVFGRRKRA